MLVCFACVCLCVSGMPAYTHVSVYMFVCVPGMAAYVHVCVQISVVLAVPTSVILRLLAVH
jgi:hypothetical protein